MLIILFLDVTTFVTISSVCYVSFDKEMYAEWKLEVDKIAQINLEKSLLVRETRDQLDLIKVNFDPQVKMADMFYLIARLNFS